MGCLEGQPSGQEVGVCLGGPGGGRKATEEGTRPAAQLRGGRRAPHLLLVAAAHAQQLRAVLLLQPRRLRLELALQPLAQVPQRRALLRRQRAHLVLQAPLQLLLLLLHLLTPRRAAGCGRQQHLRENRGRSAHGAAPRSAARPRDRHDPPLRGSAALGHGAFPSSSLDPTAARGQTELRGRRALSGRRPLCPLLEQGVPRAQKHWVFVQEACTLPAHPGWGSSPPPLRTAHSAP